MNKEQIYDEKISILMKQIIDICKESGIAMLSSFSIPTEEDSDLQCTTSLPDENGTFPDHHAAAVRALSPNHLRPMFLKTVDGKGNLTITAIL